MSGVASLRRWTAELLRRCVCQINNNNKNSSLSRVDFSGNGAETRTSTSASTSLHCPRRYTVASYVVLLPEVPPDSPETNPVMRLDALPAFSEIAPIDCVNGVAKLSIEFETELSLHAERLAQEPITFESVIHPLEVKAMPLNYAWKTAKHLSYVKRSEKYPKAFRRVHPHVIAAKNEKWTNKILYKAVQDLRNANSVGGSGVGVGGGGSSSSALVPQRLDEFQSRVLDVYELNGRLNGIRLDDVDLGKLKHFLHQLNEEKQLFRDLVVEHENKFTSSFGDKKFSASFSLTHPDDVRDMPHALIEALADDKGDPARGPWKVSLRPDLYHPFMEHCPNRPARWNAWCAFYNKGGPSHGVHDTNKKRIEDIRFGRHKQAELLGFKSYAEMSQETKMAGGVDVVLGFLENMRSFGRPVVEAQLAELEAFAKEVDGGLGKNAKLELYDVPFYRRLHRRALYPEADAGKFAEYFEFEHVFGQLLEVCARLFDLEFVRSTEGIVDVYHPDVRAYRVKDLTTGETSFLYVDPFARDEKMNGTWFESGRERCSLTSTAPIGYLNCNFRPSTRHSGSPVLLTFNQLYDLFFEMGTTLRNLLTITPYSEISGSKNVEWDAVDVPGFVMTHLLADYSVASRLSRHYATEERLPRSLFDQTLGRREHMAAFDLMWQCFLATFDVECYASLKTVWYELVRHVFQLYFPAFRFDRDNFHLPCSFVQIFSEEYPAAYYSQKWAEMVAADAWTKFEEEGGGGGGGGFRLDSPRSLAVGRSFKSTFLGLGGGIHAVEVFRRFKGNDPSTDAMLRKYKLM